MPLDQCHLVGDKSCCFDGQAARIVVRGQGSALFADRAPLSDGAATHVNLLGASIAPQPGPEISLDSPKRLEPLPMSLEGQTYEVSYSAGSSIVIALDLPEPAQLQGASTSFRGELAGAPACATSACAVEWKGDHKEVHFRRSVTTPMALTGAFPYDWRNGAKQAAHVIEVKLEGVDGNLRCKVGGDVRDTPLQAESLIWQAGRDNALVVHPLRLGGSALGITLQNSTPPERSIPPAAAVAALPVSPPPASNAWIFGAGGGLLVILTVLFAVLSKHKRRVLPQPSPRQDILHLSDLHFGTSEDAEKWFSQLAEDLRRNLQCTRLDAVILSGDIANFSTTEEYAAAQLFLEKLVAEFELSPRQVIIVPGNHDLDWGRSQRAYRSTPRATAPRSLAAGTFIDEGGATIAIRDEALYRRRFEPFAAFYEAIRTEPYPVDPGAQAILCALPAQKILVLGLNSAWELDHHFRTRASIHPGALARAMDHVRTADEYEGFLKIAVWHHPTSSAFNDRITDHGFLERLANGGFRLGLHGHIHKAENSLFRYHMGPTGQRIEMVAAGTFGAPVKEWVSGYPLQYQLLRFEGTKVTVETRRREELNGAWKSDARWTPEGGADPLPRYTLSLD